MSIRNYYEILGVLPDAEDIVITAAYRALASRYHPDKWKGDIAQANHKMADINKAYETLSDHEKRKKYDESISSFHQETKMHDEETETAFNDALNDLEVKWNLATKIFSDLIETRKHLNRTSTSLAFSFVSYLLESKNFNDRNAIAKSLEDKYFRTYFGSNMKVINFAKELIELNQREALKSLNNYLEVLGPETDPDPIIKSIIDEYQINTKRKEYWEKNTNLAEQKAFEERFQALATDVRQGYFDSALKILELSGFQYEFKNEKIKGSFFGTDRKYALFKDRKLVAENLKIDDVVKWVRDNLL